MPIPPFRYFRCIPPVGQAAKGAHVAKSYQLPCGGSHIYHGTCDSFQEDTNGGTYMINYDEIDMESMDCEEFELSFHLGLTANLKVREMSPACLRVWGVSKFCVCACVVCGCMCGHGGGSHGAWWGARVTLL